MSRRSPLLALALAVAFTLPACGLMGGADDVHESTAEPVDLALAPPTYAVGVGKGMLLRSGDARLRLRRARALEWLPGGRALIYVDAPGFTSRARIWDPDTSSLGPPVTLWRGGEALGTPDPGALKRSVTQVNVSHERLVEQEGRRVPVVGNVLTAYDLDLQRRWRTDLPGPDPIGDFRARSLERSYEQGHTIDDITYLPWGDFHAYGVEHEPHYGLLRVDAEGQVIDQVQVNQRIVSLWLSADGASLLATRRTSGHPLGGCCNVTLELVELDPATGEVAAEYGMPDEYDKSWDVTEVDKVGDRVAVRFSEYSEKLVRGQEIGSDHLRGTWVLDDDGWSMLDGSEEEVTWWQGPDDRIVARPINPEQATRFRLFWVHDDEERPLPGVLSRHRGSVPGSALPPG